MLKTALLFAVTSAALWAQITAQTHGVVSDMSGAAIPGAQVKATQTDTGISRTVTTEADGSYVITNLPLGPYRLEANKQGFSTGVQTGIVLQVGSDPAIPIALKLGAVSEQVTVESNAAQVETSSVGIGSVVENQRIIDLPLNGRLPTDLVALGGAAVNIGNSHPTELATGYYISVAGGATQGVQWSLDGAQHNDEFLGVNLPLPFPDALQEFKIATSTQEAADGGHSGGSVKAVTKSGTNSFHGDAYDFLRNYAVDARDFFAKARDGLKRNQAGGTLGGPIMKDKFFFFLGFEETFVRQTPISNVAFVPTPAMLHGDFTAFASAACQGTNRTLPAPFGTNGYAANTINPALLSLPAVNLSKLLPASLNACGMTLYGAVTHQNLFEVPVRLDYQISDKHSLFARYLIFNNQQKVPYNITPNLLIEANTGGDDQEESFAIGDTYIFNPSMVNAARVFVNRIQSQDPPAQAVGDNQLGVNMFSYDPSYIYWAITGGFTIGSTQDNIRNFYTYVGGNDDFSIVHGSHQFRFGGHVERSIVNESANPWGGGNFNFTGSATGLGLADFLLGDVASMRQASAPEPLVVRQNFFNLYAQDTWKINRKLTLNYGLNWEPWFAAYFPSGETTDFSLAGFYAGQRSSVFPTAPLGFTYPGDAGFYGKSGVPSQWHNFDPRVGVAWDPKGDGKMAVRAGAGIARDYPLPELLLNNMGESPFGLSYVITGVNLVNPWASQPGGDPYPYVFSKSSPEFPAYASYLPFPNQLNSMIQYSWNVGVQRQITPTWFATAQYLGTHIIHIYDVVEQNPAEYIPGSCAAGQYGLAAPGLCTQAGNLNQRRILNIAVPGTQLGYVTEYDDGGTQGYNGLLLTTNWRFHSNIALNANYTYSHCIVSPVGNLVLLNPGMNYEHQAYQDVGPVNRNLDSGDCVQDRRQIANVTLVAQMPKFSNRYARMVGSGWTASSTIVARSGAPLSITTGQNPDPATGFTAVHPNQVLPNVYSATQGASCGAAGSFCEQWLNPAAFAAPVLGTFGDQGQYVVIGPAFWEWDQTISRQFTIIEQQKLEIRFEAFNLTNSFRPGNPGTTTGAASTFGLITSDATPPAATTAPARVLQFALKYSF